ncbi:adenylyltransferase/cytidyltransferase family protein, partial [Chromohalobacter sp. HP20-39]|uniref:adenylyltransferase/cytidyltransferase family protein n=1 Tax=Chromohalobacter sp. HP20-39 TaxID=3079306 RepID=UPI00294B0916
MKVFRGLPNAESRAPCALTIGNFDGVHRGHQSLLARARAAADARGLPLTVMTFEPHPRSFFSPNTPQFRLTDETNKLRLLAATGLAGAVVMTFDKA